MRGCVCRVQGVTGGVLRGAGKQLVGALCNLVGHYFIGFPIGVSLMFAANMGIMGKRKTLLHFVRDSNKRLEESALVFSVKGLWTGLTICVLMQSMFFLAYLAKLDWKKAADDVRFPAVNQNCPPISVSLRCTWFQIALIICASNVAGYDQSRSQIQRRNQNDQD